MPSAPAHHRPRGRALGLPPASPWWSLVALLLPWFAWFLLSFARGASRASEAYARNTQAWPEAASGLRETWVSRLTGRRTDVKDAQWGAFRGGMPTLAGAFAAFVLVRRAAARLAYPRAKTVVGMAFAIGMVVVVHGVGAAPCLASVTATYVVVAKVLRNAPPAYRKAAAWILSLGVLLAAKRANDGYHALLVELAEPYVGPNLARHRMMPWHHCFNLVVLRVISFACDVADAQAAEPPAHIDDSLPTYLLYVLYSPLYISGPIMRYSDFYQDESAVAPTTRPLTDNVRSYTIRFIVDLLLFEVLSNFFYPTALARLVAHNQAYMSPELRSLVHDDYETMVYASFAALFGVWFKFLLIWRFARLAALLDGIDPPENMRRCIANNYTVRGFWKDWHCSFNAWLVRYVYVPLGGSRVGALRQILSAVACFGFVAMWHDLEVHLAAWGLLLSVFMAPEIIASRWSQTSRTALHWQRHRRGLWTFLECVAGGVAIVCLQIGNMVGYTMGVDATRHLVWDGPMLRTWQGRFFVARWLVYMSLGAFTMVEVRKWEDAVAVVPATVVVPAPTDSTAAKEDKPPRRPRTKSTEAKSE